MTIIDRIIFIIIIVGGTIEIIKGIKEIIDYDE